MFQNNLPYNSFRSYIRSKFDCLVWKITLDGDFTCPNRDGSKSFGGCTFCTPDGSSSLLQDADDTIYNQVIKGIAKHRERHKAKKFISYLQSFTATYAEIEKLRTIYNQAISHKDIIMLFIGTRPDCLPLETIKLIESYNEKVEVWLDIGLQSIHDKTLKLINRQHCLKDFIDSIDNIKKFAPKTKICVHIMAGLPEESMEESYQTALFVSQLPIDGIKLHNLCIIKNTIMAEQYKKAKINILEIDDYMNFVISVLRILPPNIIVHRLMAEASLKQDLIAPLWANNKDNFLIKLRDKMNKNGFLQGDSL